jgi:uncharacterized protein YgiM (DUF1202 family)
MKPSFAHTFIIILALTLSLAARAATVETKVRLLVRERASSTSRIVDRVAAGKKLPVIGREGNWIHVRSGGRDGWVPAEAVKGAAAREGDSAGEAQPSDDEPSRPLAKKRGVRPEAWVSKSRYHEEDSKLIISVNKAEIYGRPSTGGAVLGILRRGEAVTMVTRSPDKKWVNVDIGGGSTAWIEARAVKPGKVQTETPPPEESAQAEAAPPPTITPDEAKRKAKLAKAETPPEPVQQAEPPPPPAPPAKKKLKSTPEPETPSTPAGKSSEDETPPGLAQTTPPPSTSSPVTAEPPTDKGKKKKKGKPTTLASRSDESATASAPEGTVVRDSWTQRGKVYVSPGVRAGIAIIEQRFTSNGTGALTNYQGSTSAFGAQVGLGLWGTIGRYFILGGDASYTFAGAASLRYVQPTDGTAVTMGVQSHTADVGAAAGVHFGVLGGLSLRLRIGGQMVLNLIQPDVRTKLPSDRILGMTIGLGVTAPALFHIARRPFGVALFGGGLVPAQRAQTVGLEDGAQSSTYGAFFGGGLSFALLAPNPERYRGQLALEANYSYEFAATHYTGLSRRNNTITIADRGSGQHLIALGLGFYY